MAAVIGDYVSGLSRFHGMISSTTPIQQHQGQQRSSSHDSSSVAIYRSSSRNRPSAVTSVPRPHRHDAAPAPPHTHSSQPQAQPHPPSQPPQPLPRFQPQPPPAAPSSAPFVAASSISSSSSSPSSLDASSPSQNASRRTSSSTGAASRLPSPPPSSSPAAAPCPPDTEDGKRPAPMASHIGDGVSATNRPQASTAAGMVQQPTPPDDSQLTGPTAASAPGSSSGSYLVASSSSTSGSPRPRQGNVIHIRDLAHIESLVRADPLDGSGSPAILQDPSPQQVNYEISAMPIDDIIEMVAALLTKITATNDLQHDAMQRNVAHQQQASQNADANGASQMSPLSHSVLAFHGRNVPAITILSYLSRIHKYCPTTYEVFLSLLVYFDRMTEKVNEMVMEGEERQSASRPGLSLCAHDARETHGETHGSDESDSDLADEDDEGEERTAEVYIKVEDADADADEEEEEEEDDDMMDSPHVGRVSGHAATSPSAAYFVVDSFNIHRLIIAGVTCASKFFSDVFYTNSRYAKVGGLPLAELNHLEIQFLVLNDFRLAIPVEDLETYATMLVEFYAREVVAPRSRRAAE